MRHTGITHLDGSKTLVLGTGYVITNGVSIITFPEIPDEEVKVIMEANQEQVQNLLSKYF